MTAVEEGDGVGAEQVGLVTLVDERLDVDGGLLRNRVQLVLSRLDGGDDLVLLVRAPRRRVGGRERVGRNSDIEDIRQIGLHRGGVLAGAVRVGERRVVRDGVAQVLQDVGFGVRGAVEQGGPSRQFVHLFDELLFDEFGADERDQHDDAGERKAGRRDVVPVKIVCRLDFGEECIGFLFG